MRRNVVWPSDSSDQVQLVCDPQRTVWRGNRGDWAVLFLDNEWSVIAKDREGVRRARETLTAFLGPRLGRLAGEVVPIDGPNPDSPVMVTNTGYWMGPDITIAQAGKGRVRAYGRVWDFEGRSAEICQINWHGPN